MKSDLEAEVTKLRDLLAEKEEEIRELRLRLAAFQGQTDLSSNHHEEKMDSEEQETRLNNTDIARYSRQILLPEFRAAGQIALKNSRVLVVGCGGLGCPVALYLAAAGVGQIGLIDYDTIEISNLHRQVLHTQKGLGEKKCESAARAVTNLNPDCKAVPIHTALHSGNTMDLVSQYDVVVDCSDNVATRYLLNDACVLAKKPLVSGSALRWEGQLTVYNYGEEGPTYRCLYPSPPPPGTVTNCGDGGVMGAVTGIIGCLQALETVKILVPSLSPSYSGKMLLFDGLTGSVRVVKLRPRNADTVKSVQELVDYEQFCGAKATDKESHLKVLSREDRITVEDLQKLIKSKEGPTLLDVRSQPEWEMCRLPGSLCLPYSEFNVNKGEELNKLMSTLDKDKDVVIICRRGNDSQLAVQHIKERFPDLKISDVIGGLHSWTKIIDKDFPIY